MGWLAAEWFLLAVRGIVVSIRPWECFESAQWSWLAIFLDFTESFDDNPVFLSSIHC